LFQKVLQLKPGWKGQSWKRLSSHKECNARGEEEEKEEEEEEEDDKEECSS
jgi:hypothetical protein